MLFLTIMQHYLLWHYSEAYKQLFGVWRNIIWFVIHFFSIPQLLMTLFSPWKRMVEERKKSWDIEDFASRIIINIISRIIGAIMRMGVIAVGLVSLSVTLFAAITTYTLWLIAPLIIVASFILGIVYIIV